MTSQECSDEELIDSSDFEFEAPINTNTSYHTALVEEQTSNP